jgi:hypothetical protein
MASAAGKGEVRRGDTFRDVFSAKPQPQRISDQSLQALDVPRRASDDPAKCGTVSVRKARRGRYPTHCVVTGKFEDDIRIHISHTDLGIPGSLPRRRMTLKELKGSLPSGWDVYETLDSRYFFYCGALERGGVFKSAWTHPNPTFDLFRYELPSEEELSYCEPRYEALSYAWGPAHNRVAAYVEISNQCPSTPPSLASLSIGRNLASALRHLRYGDRARTSWIDAICINQADIAERDEQVTRMTDIDRLASRVIAWLEPEADNSGYAPATIEELGKQVVLTMYDWFFSPDATETAWCLSKCDLPYEHETRVAMHRLLLRPWFERVWVVQEVNRHAVIQCGRDEIAWTYFRQGVVCLWHKDRIPPSVSRVRLALAGRLAVDGNSPISSVLRRKDGRGCSDPRDLIYGLLGLFPPVFRRNIRPQYALSVGDVYKAMFLAHVDHVNRLNFFPSHHVEGSLIGTPSWVPDFSSQSSHSGEPQFCGSYSCAISKYQPSNILEVVGRQCATLRSANQPVPTDQRSPGSAFRFPIETVRKWKPNDLQTSYYVTGESLLNAYAKTLTGNYLRERFPTMPIATLNEWVRQD